MISYKHISLHSFWPVRHRQRDFNQFVSVPEQGCDSEAGDDYGR